MDNDEENEAIRDGITTYNVARGNKAYSHYYFGGKRHSSDLYVYIGIFTILLLIAIGSFFMHLFTYFKQHHLFEFLNYFSFKKIPFKSNLSYEEQEKRNADKALFELGKHSKWNDAKNLNAQINYFLTYHKGKFLFAFLFLVSCVIYFGSIAFDLLINSDASKIVEIKSIENIPYNKNYVIGVAIAWFFFLGVICAMFIQGPEVLDYDSNIRKKTYKANQIAPEPQK